MKQQLMRIASVAVSASTAQNIRVGDDGLAHAIEEEVLRLQRTPSTGGCDGTLITAIELD